MKTFKVTGKYIEFLPEREIKANTVEEAEEKYTELWDEGMILVHNSDMETEAEEIK